jgi:hypothetical protein
MITRAGAVVLVQQYENIGLELRLIMDVQERLLTRLWRERSSRRGEVEPDAEYEP